MTTGKRNCIGLTAGLGFIGLLIAAYALAHHIDPYIREQAIVYLQRRFDSEVEIASLRITLPNTSPLKLLLSVAAELL